VVRTLPAFVDDVVLVDDASPDGLESALLDLERPGLHVVRRSVNGGVGAAVVDGFRKATSLNADIIVKMDGDGQMDPAHLARLLLPIIRRQADLTKGNRFMHRWTLRGMPAPRLLGNVALSFMAKMASGYWHLFDPTNGYIALRRQLVEVLAFHRLAPRYFFEISLLSEAYLAGAVAKDVGMPALYADEKSSLSIARVLLQFPALLFRTACRRVIIRYFLWDFTPVALFLVFGLALLTFGVTFGGWHWATNYSQGVPTPTGTIVLSMACLFLGFELVLQALVMDIINVPRESEWVDSTHPPSPDLPRAFAESARVPEAREDDRRAWAIDR
jgi:glycosyltransferase involved in cell wall biosynthesis